MVGTAMSTPSTFFILVIICAASLITPRSADTLMSGSRLDILLSTNLLKPLNTDITQIIAIAVTATAQTAITEMMLTAVCDFFDSR